MKVVAWVAAGLAILAGLVVGTFLVVGADRFWRLFGDPDMGSVTFETLARSRTPNDALACPPGLCAAAADITPPGFAIAAPDLRRAFATVIAAEPRITVVETDDAALADRYVQRSRLLGFPDTIVVRFLELPDGRSTLALYSRSLIGHGDMGVNRARIERWLAALAALVPPAS